MAITKHSLTDTVKEPRNRVSDTVSLANKQTNQSFLVLKRRNIDSPTIVSCRLPGSRWTTRLHNTLVPLLRSLSRPVASLFPPCSSDIRHSTFHDFVAPHTQVHPFFSRTMLSFPTRQSVSCPPILRNFDAQVTGLYS